MDLCTTLLPSSPTFISASPSTLIPPFTEGIDENTQQYLHPSLTPITSPKRPFSSSSSPSSSLPCQHKRRPNLINGNPVPLSTSLADHPPASLSSLRQKLQRDGPSPKQLTSSNNVPGLIEGFSSTESPPQPSSRPSTSTSTTARDINHGQDEYDDDNDDHPLRYIPERYVGGFLGSPRLHFYPRHNEAADIEFKDRLKNSLLNFMSSKIQYTSYCIVLTHAGYTPLRSLPVVLLCAKALTDDDGREAIQLFNSSGCSVIQRLFCYEGETGGYMSGRRLRKYHEKAQPGCSIGPKGQARAFSIGPFVRFDDDEHTYCISVHHGLKDDTLPITPETDPPVYIQQPSVKDLDASITAKREALELATESVRKNLLAENVLRNELDDLERIDTNLGVVIASECRLISYEDELLNSDICLIKLNEERVGVNQVPLTDDMIESEAHHWVPHDKAGMFLRGLNSLQFGQRVMKTGKTTGSTEGITEFRYAHARLEGSQAVTSSEFCVISEDRETKFADRGDSGGVVVDTSGYVVGMVLGGTCGWPKKLVGHEALGELFVTYITPFQLVLKRIDVLTGKHSSLIVPDASDWSARDFASPPPAGHDRCS